MSITLIESSSSRAKHETYQRGVAEAGGRGHFLCHLARDPISVYYEDF